jgi:four helix bundle protein
MSQELVDRTKSFAIQTIRYCRSLPKLREEDTIARQLLRSAMSVGANYRAACDARSRREFISKLCITREEADESQYWIELLTECAGRSDDLADGLLAEAKELTAILTVSIRTARRNNEDLKK